MFTPWGRGGPETDGRGVGQLVGCGETRTWTGTLGPRAAVSAPAHSGGPWGMARAGPCQCRWRGRGRPPVGIQPAPSSRRAQVRGRRLHRPEGPSASRQGRSGTAPRLLPARRSGGGGHPEPAQGAVQGAFNGAGGQCGRGRYVRLGAPTAPAGRRVDPGGFEAQGNTRATGARPRPGGPGQTAAVSWGALGFPGGGREGRAALPRRWPGWLTPQKAVPAWFRGLESAVRVPGPSGSCRGPPPGPRAAFGALCPRTDSHGEGPNLLTSPARNPCPGARLRIPSRRAELGFQHRSFQGVWGVVHKHSACNRYEIPQQILGN